MSVLGGNTSNLLDGIRRVVESSKNLLISQSCHQLVRQSIPSNVATVLDTAKHTVWPIESIGINVEQESLQFVFFFEVIIESIVRTVGSIIKI
jgi:hypothetical protein